MSMTAHLHFSDVRSSETHPDQFRLEDEDWNTVCVFVDTVEGYDRIIEEAKKGRALLAAAQTQAVA